MDIPDDADVFGYGTNPRLVISPLDYGYWGV
jgi:hypothetical protein